MSDTIAPTGTPPAPPAASCDGDPNQPTILYVLLTYRTHLSFDVSVAWKTLLRGRMTEALRSASLLLVLEGNETDPNISEAIGCETLLVLCVNDWRRGLAIVRRELEDLHLAHFARIIRRDFGEDINRSVYPDLSAAPFAPEEIARGLAANAAQEHELLISEKEALQKRIRQLTDGQNPDAPK